MNIINMSIISVGDIRTDFCSCLAVSLGEDQNEQKWKLSPGLGNSIFKDITMCKIMVC